MKYVKKMNLWEAGVQEKILSGEVVLQRGQWLVCGDNASKPCRYVGHNGTTINVVHWQGSAKETTALFNARIGK